MTFRARTGTGRPRTWDDRDRRSFLLNVGFGLTVLAAVLLLLLAFGVSWYGEHLAAAATVNGQTVTRDAYAKQLAVNEFRVDYQTRRIRTLLTAGRIRPADAEARLATLAQYREQGATIALEQLIDGRIMDQLAADRGLTASEADIDARIVEEATTPELRHAWVIAVEPELAAGETEPSAEAIAAARTKAGQALADLRAGKDWDTIAKTVSTDASRDQAGDLGYIDEDASLDAPFLAALEAATEDTPTDVIAGDDGIFRVGRVTEVVAPVVDATLEQQAVDDGVDREAFRAAMRTDAIRTKLSDAVLAPMLAAGPQREVQEIFLQEGASESLPGAVRVRHILYSPNGDPSSASTVAEDDPAWADAKAKADATYAKLRTDIDQFDAIARAESDEDLARESGGKLPYYAVSDSIDPAFASAIFTGAPEAGELLAPVRSSFGWHVIQVMHYPTDMEWANKLKAEAEGGADFGGLARDNSDRAAAEDGGDIGWIGKGMLDPALEAALFAAKVGGVSDPVKLDRDGVYLYKVVAEETREPDEEQKRTLESTAFSRWYSEQKALFEVTREAADEPAAGAAAG